MKMTKEDFLNYYLLVRELKTSTMESTLRSKVMSNYRAAKKIAEEMDNAKKTLLENMSEQESADNEIRKAAHARLNQKGGGELTDEEISAIERLKPFDEACGLSLNQLLKEEAPDFARITQEDFDQFADLTAMTVAQYEIWEKRLVEEKPE